MFVLAVVAITAIVALGGCKKQEPAAPPHEHEHEAAAPTQEAPAAAQIEQTMCPVMHNMKINPEVFVEYKGKKVYFCCPDCKAKFQADPEKYVANLPQFKQ